MSMGEGLEAVPTQTWRRVLHDATMRPGNVKSWLRMGWPKHPQEGAEANLLQRLHGLDRKYPGGAQAVVRFLEQERLVESNGNGRFKLTAAGVLRSQ